MTMTPEQIIRSPRQQHESHTRDAITKAFEESEALHAAESARAHAVEARKAQGLKTVRFLQDYLRHNLANVVGDIAGVEPGLAESLRQAGIVSFDMEPPPAPFLEALPHVKPPEAAITTVRILKNPPGTPYSRGDVVGVSAAAAAMFINAGHAEPVVLQSAAKRLLDGARRAFRASRP